MIGTSKFEYLYIQFFIKVLHHVAPLSILYCIGSVVFYGPSIILISPFSLYALAETLFFVAYFPYNSYLQRVSSCGPILNRKERRELVTLCHKNIPDPVSYLRTWLLGAELTEIKRDNICDFILWAFFNRGGPPGDDIEEINTYIDELEILLGHRFEEGRGKAVALRLTLDKLNMLHRSLLWYFCVGFVDTLTHVIMYYHGFNFYRISYGRFFTNFPFRPLSLLSTRKSPVTKTSYWYREHKSKTMLPVVFLHGIGIGLYPYTPFLKELNNSKNSYFSSVDQQIGIVAIENLHISFRLTHAPDSNKEFCSQVEQILLNHFTPNQKFVFVAHSFGTNFISVLLKNPSTARFIKSVVLIDPVSILLHLPDVTFNFMRKVPSKANEHQLFYFATMDMGISHTLGRHFNWCEAILWKETLGNRNITVSLSGRDLIIDAESVGRYLSTGYTREFSGSDSDSGYASPGGKGCTSLTSEGYRTRKSRFRGSLSSQTVNNEWKYRSWRGTGIDILWHEELDHAQVFDKYTTRRDLVEVIRTYCREGYTTR